ncbi:protein involved in polysaccharide export, contains SLBB domain of the beta-grasp fold [Candidatus Thermokryptus mobilis]|uniref:Protein involved in polysaccharide export, contains SLBB domain of the beta-grasp fold n=1 Tax=Candidatus Thermokryptus mobilis TaxID=1643428 RepID=A0A0S4MPU4_9BACT|nr:SLBB domain-containing protein [Candidatus Thermokryptus mobilis]CUU01074.1 protein involved in polysaccharide export, contains SLBB domain of the beta-grasp fold [Candidatus Thermokryptus mobilis]
MRRFFLIIMVIFFNTGLLCQVETKMGEEKGFVKFGDVFKQAQNLQFPIFDPNVLTLERPIDPESYIVGPGDILSVNIWTSPPLNFLVQVTVEGTVIIPTVGEVKVAGRTLSDAKKEMMQKIRAKYISGEISVTLVAPRTFYITITGYAPRYEKYKVRSIDRVSNALALAFQPIDTFRIERRILMADSVNFRKIQLRRNGAILNVDLRKYFATGDDKYNPYLLEGDWLILQRRDPNSFVSIYGAVNKPGSYEFVEGDKLRDIIEIAGGTLESADIERIEISRLDEQGKIKEKIYVNFKDILNGSVEDISLERNDRIFVPEKRTLKQDYKVTITGEVKRPGTYPISRNGTMLSQILKEAQLTEYADVANVLVISGGVNNPIAVRIDTLLPLLLLKNFVFPSSDSLYFSYEVDVLKSLKFKSIDAERVISGLEDYELQDGNLIYVPPRYNFVYVFGQVNNPGFVSYEKGRDYRYYISRAGGFSQFARKGDVKVIKRKTYTWSDAEDVEIEPGDYIFVPKKIIREPIYYWNLAKDIILTVGAVASTVATIILISNQLKTK